MGVESIGNWGSHKAPGLQGMSGQRQCLKEEFGYHRGVECAERRRETKGAHHLLVRLAKHELTVSLLLSKVERKNID